MKLGRYTIAFNSRQLLHSAVSLFAVTLLAVYTGGSVPNEFRRYIVTPQDTSSAALQRAIDDAAPEASAEDWQSVSHYAVQNQIKGAMNAAERSAARTARLQLASMATDEASIRQRIRMPLLPGPVIGTAGPAQRERTEMQPVAPARAAVAPAANKMTARESAPAAPATPLAEDLATIEALKAALQELKKDGLHAGTYRDDIADK